MSGEAPPVSDDLWTVMNSATAVRRYRDEPVPADVLERCLQAASWAPSGGNQQPWKFVVLNSPQVRSVVTSAAHRTWEVMKDFYRLAEPDETADDPKSRTIRTMAEHMRVGGNAPALVLFCVQPQRGTTELQQGGSIFPAVQNFLLAARAQGLGAAITLWQDSCDSELRELVGIPEDWKVATLLTVGWPRGAHHVVRRKPLTEVAACDHWHRPWQSS
ncbi:nitroreductase family protein [Mycobacterium sp. pV006]|uniref:nitroreductase family protein n=1 Tax=Mycobacterium sp. pV006 TaxID=3238983 RepID=UPI00351B7562